MLITYLKDWELEIEEEELKDLDSHVNNHTCVYVYFHLSD